MDPEEDRSPAAKGGRQVARTESQTSCSISSACHRMNQSGEHAPVRSLDSIRFSSFGAVRGERSYPSLR